MVITKKKNGVYAAKIKTDFGKRQISLKTRDKKEAKRIAKESKIKELEAAAKASRVTQQTVAQIISGKDIPINEALQEWSRWFDMVGMSTRTRDNTITYVRRWARDMGVEKKYPSSIKTEHIHNWINDPSDKSKLGTRNVKLSSLRSFFEFCSAKGWCLGDPSRLVRVNMRLMTHEQKEVKKKCAFTDNQVAKLLNETEGFWNAAVAIGRYAGLRIGDIAQLEWSSFSEPGKIIVWTDKRDRRVSLPLTQEIEQAIAKIPYKHKTYVFPDQRADAIDPNKRSKLSIGFIRILERLGIEGKSFHCLRYSYAQACKKAGIPMPHIKENMGHVSEETTEGYLQNGQEP